MTIDNDGTSSELIEKEPDNSKGNLSKLLYGENLFGDSAEPVASGPLSEKFTFPPFSVLSARDGDWQRRKRSWIGLGIKSEEGRAAPPGGGAMPAANYANGERGDAVGRRVMATTTVCATEWMKRGPDAGGSIFDPVLAELSYKWFCPAGGQIVDPFAGGSVRGLVAGLLGFRYHGIDLRPEQISANIEQRDSIIGPCLPGMEDANSVEWKCGDSRVLLAEAPEADFVFSCPPYGDLEQYSDDPLDLSSMDYPAFLLAYRDIIAQASSKLKMDRMACFVVGDFRDKKTGNYRGFVADTINAFRDAGLPLYNDAILVTSVGSLPVRVSGQFDASRKLGKALRNGTPVLTPTGWVSIEDLSIGQQVIAGDGTPTEVTGVFPQGVRKLFTIAFHDGCEIDADEEHLWQIDVRGKSNIEHEVLSTAQIIDKYGSAPSDPRPMVPFCGAVQFEEWPIPLDAYLVGLLLGDGGLTQNTPVLSSADAETVERLPSLLPPGVTIKQRGYDFRLVGEGSRSLKNPLTVALRTLGMMGFGSLKKSVPDLYLWNSAEVRLSVLRGLMDTDGSVTPGPSGSCEFGSGSKALAEGVMFLVRSLGGRSSMTTRSTASGNPGYRVLVRGGPCPFLLRRKADIWKDADAARVRCKERRIESILPADPGEATCISVAHKSKLYVVKDFIVTHNTHQNVLCFAKGDPRKAFL